MTMTRWDAVQSTQTMARTRNLDHTKIFPLGAGRIQVELPDPARLLRVLVVDDDCDTADSLTMLLRLWGHEVWSAYAGAAALQLAAEVRPDVMLLDVAMPKMNGCEVAQRLRGSRSFESTRIVAISGYVDDAHRELCRQAGFHDFLVKPLEIAGLQKLLAAECARLPRLRKLPADQPSAAEPRRPYMIANGRAHENGALPGVIASAS